MYVKIDSNGDLTGTMVGNVLKTSDRLIINPTAEILEAEGYWPLVESVGEAEPREGYYAVTKYRMNQAGDGVEEYHEYRPVPEPVEITPTDEEEEE